MKKEPSRDTVYKEEFVLKLLVFGVGVCVIDTENTTVVFDRWCQRFCKVRVLELM